MQEDVTNQNFQLGFNTKKALIVVRDVSYMPSLLNLTWVD
jgi:hypothetical protein